MYRPRSCIPEVVSQVYIRNMKGIRGYCIAFVAAFDKHWNLALEDVTEVWTRPVKRKAVALALSETFWVSDRPPLQPLSLLSWWSEPLPQHNRRFIKAILTTCPSGQSHSHNTSGDSSRLSHHLSELNLCKEVYHNTSGDSSRLSHHLSELNLCKEVYRSTTDI
uniref:LSM domain-containing protein n=1 Tax=Timema poppense TaxID=170557 RepID=A0A7R9HC24_TIMPO|nr:unnamed protein product [Timema poppensis]